MWISRWKIGPTFALASLSPRQEPVMMVAVVMVCGEQGCTEPNGRNSSKFTPFFANNHHRH
jgi:hypothetical protein